MGWFWSDASARPAVVVAPHPLPKDGASPPPGCPMHESSSPSSPFSARQTATTTAPSSCPVKSPPQASSYSSSPPQTSQSTLSKLNPLNYMPSLPNSVQSEHQSIDLPLSRETSSIPRGDADSNWEYPSPQQMYNAMLRKGYTDTPADAVESMVAVHNFLNEGAWAEIVEWETIFAQGLGKGWERCREGEEGLARQRARREFMKERREALGLPATSSSSTRTASSSNPSTRSTSTEPIYEPKLLRFQGRPSEPTPKSRILQTLGMIYPSKFASEPPFDRHDWFVARQQPDGSVKEVRYVIDYYGGGLQATGEPVFYLDIRPAVDSPVAVAERMVRWGGDVWWRASGGAARKGED